MVCSPSGNLREKMRGSGQRPQSSSLHNRHAVQSSHEIAISQGRTIAGRSDSYNVHIRKDLHDSPASSRRVWSVSIVDAFPKSSERAGAERLAVLPNPCHILYLSQNAYIQ